MVGLLLAYVAVAITVDVVMGWRRERHMARQIDLLAEQASILSSLQRGQTRIGESLAEVETAAAIHTASQPGRGGVEETQRRRALRSSQTNEE